MKKIVAILAILVFLASMGLAMASKSEETTIPSDWIGKTKVVNEKEKLTQVVFINYEEDFQQEISPLTDIGDPDDDGDQDGYDLIGYYWNLDDYTSGIPYVINPSVAVKKYELDEDDVVNEIKASLESWNQAVYYVSLYNNNPVIDYDARASIGRPDYKNVITWRGLQKGIIAVAITWYDPTTGEIVDADIILRHGYNWGIADGDEEEIDLTDAFDIQNIVTHESGHWTGLDDIYDEEYDAMTMYGYSAYGEEIRRSLEPGDIAGAQEVYASWIQP